MDEYHTTLEALSNLIAQKVKYDLDDSGKMTVNKDVPKELIDHEIEQMEQAYTQVFLRT